MTKPGKKIILLIALLLAGSGVAYALALTARKETYVAPSVSVEEKKTFLSLDSDNDTLKDWEEGLWKTDAQKSDTDGDGTVDGAEVKAGRNPLVAGPNDKLDTDTVDAKINTETDADLSDTDKFSRELFVKIIAAKENDTPPTDEDLQKFLSASISQEVELQKQKSFEAGDFHVDLAETPESIKAYGEELAGILTKKPPQKMEYELFIVERAEKNKDANELQKLIPIAAEYTRIKNDLLKLAVPQSAIETHAALTNAAAKMAWSITGLQYLLTDPVRALPGASAYADNSAAFFKALHEYKDYFSQSGVMFEEGERGYNFFDKL